MNSFKLKYHPEKIKPFIWKLFQKGKYELFIHRTKTGMKRQHALKYVQKHSNKYCNLLVKALK